MSKRNPKRSRESFPKLPGGQKEQPVQTTSSGQAMRETIESIVIAFILAFLFRTFEAEAFVIPTGSMAPTLQGRHKDVDCPECGYRFRVGASEEEDSDTRQRAFELRKKIRELEKEIEYLRQRPRNEDQINAKLYEIKNLEYQIRYQDVLTGECPICRYNMVLSDDLPPGLKSLGGDEAIVEAPSYSGDRILVNKYIYSFTDPKRWDVVVFKFPGNAQMNYIKRLVGLPGEILQIYQGDLFSGDKKSENQDDYAIARKPPDKVLTMRQPVHDTDYEPADLYEAGWPLRWQPMATEGWEVQADIQGKLVHQQFISQPTGDEVAWLRYRHTIPNFDDWLQVEEHNGQAGSLGDLARPHLISDFNPYNARIKLFDTTLGYTLEIPPEREGLHWVGDLMLEAEVDIKTPQGELLLDLVEGGRHFTARIDLATGRASLSIDGLPDFKPEADTGLTGPGSYRVGLANVDDQLMLWVDRRLVKFSEPTIYNADELYGGRKNNVPQTSSDDPGDLAPAGIGAQNAEVAISRLRLWRDIYYIADNWERDPRLVTDLPKVLNNGQPDYLSDPNDWGVFAGRRSEDFPLGDDQYFVMGDNSPESLDARLWKGQSQSIRGIPGGAYLERRLLIGKALCVYWPHAWYYIPGTPVPVWPNFTDVRLVK